MPEAKAATQHGKQRKERALAVFKDHIVDPNTKAGGKEVEKRRKRRASPPLLIEIERIPAISVVVVVVVIVVASSTRRRWEEMAIEMRGVLQRKGDGRSLLALI